MNISGAIRNVEKKIILDLYNNVHDLQILCIFKTLKKFKFKKEFINRKENRKQNIEIEIEKEIVRQPDQPTMAHVLFHALTQQTTNLAHFAAAQQQPSLSFSLSLMRGTRGGLRVEPKKHSRGFLQNCHRHHPHAHRHLPAYLRCRPPSSSKSDRRGTRRRL